MTAIPDFSQIFQEVPWGWAITDAASHALLLMNPAFARLHGYTVKELQGQPLHALMAPGSRPEFHEHLRRARENDYHIYESQHQRKDGEVFPVQVNLAAHKDESGNAKFHSAVVHDLTGTPQAEAKLRERHWRAGGQISNDAIITADATDKIIFWNTRAQDIFGYPEEELRGLDFPKLIATRHINNFQQEIERLLVLGETAPAGDILKITGRRKDGSEFPMEMSLSAWYSQKQRFITAIIKDITHRKRTAEALHKSQAILAKTQQLTHAGSWDWDLTKDQFSLSDEIYRIFGLTPGEFGGSYAEFVALIHPEDQDTVKSSVSRVLAKNLPFELNYRVMRPDGSVREVQSQGEVFFDEGGKPLRMVGTVHDVTEQKRAEEERRTLSMAVEQASDWVMITNKQGRIEYVNPAVTATTGYTRKDLLGQSPAIFKSGKHDAKFYQELWRAISSGHTYRNVFTNRKKNHELFHLDMTITPVRDHQGTITHYLATAKDITHQLDLEERLNHLAYYDGLTGIPNRNLASDRLKQALARAEANKKSVALLFLDIDRFKFLNDTFGPDLGDRILKETAARLVKVIGEEESVGRVGSDEFTVVLVHLNHPDDAVMMIEQIKEAICEPMKLNEEEIIVTGSIGVSLYPQDSSDQITLMKNATTACFRAKSLGGNNYQFFSPGMNIMAEEFVTLGKKLFQATKKEEFVLHYQPYYQIDTDQIVGLEALIRWQRPEYGLLPPGTFIPVLEETGIIREVGEWTMRETWRQVKTWLAAGLPVVPVSVNFSPIQFRCCELPDMVERVMGETGMDPRYIFLEITETALMQDVDFTRTVLKQFKEMGFGIAIDDFGTGYSSLNYLKKFPIDYLKIDISFINDLIVDPDAAAIVMAIISMAHNLGLKTIAEGVETKEQCQILRLLRCDIVQGFYYSHPQPAAEIEKILTTSTSPHPGGGRAA